MRSNHRGFTLTELLVVVGIIIILMGLLIPALGAARRAARKAGTESTMTGVISAVQQFRTDNNRLPGYVSQQALSESARPGFTTMENALLDLGGGVDPETPVDPAKGVIEMEVQSGDQFIVNTRLIGSTEGPGYLTGVTTSLQAVDQSKQDFGGSTGAPQMDEELMPDVVDGWGNPIALWIKDEFAGSTEDFAEIDWGNGASPAQFYYSCNSGYYRTTRQAESSLLNTRGLRDANVLLTMEALLGHPSFPKDVNVDPIEPALPRGDFILHSAGSDELYLERERQTVERVIYNPGDSELDEAETTMDALDDVIKAAS